MKNIVIEVSKQFSRFPAGRYKKDGLNSGERFRDEFLVPEFQNPENLIKVDFRGTRGVASSFLEESFGGLIRKGFSADEVLKRLEIVSADPTIELEIRKYILDVKK